LIQVEKMLDEDNRICMVKQSVRKCCYFRFKHS